MQLKDYYKTLNVPPNAGANEIRKAFRSLALKYHPDKNNGDKYKEAMFREVQEAYETLSDTKRREEYNYKRWYTRSLGKSFREAALTPSQILAEARRLADHMEAQNNLQVDYDLLSQRIRNILSSQHIAILHQFNDTAVNEQIIKVILKTSAPLPIRYLEPISLLLADVAGSDNNLLKEIRETTRDKSWNEYWQKRTWWLVILAAVVLCWMMYIYAS
jgi:curved DNA-binding protein CbpA